VEVFVLVVLGSVEEASFSRSASKKVKRLLIKHQLQFTKPLHIFLHNLPARCPIPEVPLLIKIVARKSGGKQLHQNPPVDPQMLDNRKVIWGALLQPTAEHRIP
jgi:hypothetical protein